MREDSKTFVRIRRVIMKDFRNIEYGKVDFPNSNFEEIMNEEPSILGLYGQNGSGKTSLVMALDFLKKALAGDSFADSDYNGCIRAGCDHAELEYELAYCTEDNLQLLISYSFKLSEKEREAKDRDGNQISEIVYCISDETLSYKGTNPDGTKIGKSLLFDTTPGASRKGYAFGRDTSYVALVGKNKETANQLREAKAVHYNSCESFIFSEEVFNAVNEKNKDSVYSFMILYLHMFGGAYMHVIDNHTTGMNNLNIALPLIIWAIKPNRIQYTNALLRIGRGEFASVSLENYPDFCEAIKGFNEVLCELVPGMQLEIEEHGISKSPRGTDVQTFKILSCRKGIKIPLNCESDGIRRIISIMSLLIGVYNQRSMTVVIDEIDSGIYEYLLGEILRIMGKSARGQLVFTSHNLRALEVLPSKYICFTSTNPEKRYTKINRTGNSNLRDLYYRKIVLGSDDEQLYDPTDNYEIDLAFYNAGRIQDKTLT